MRVDSSITVSCFHVILGLPSPRFPSSYMSKAVLTASLERSTYLYQRSLLSFRMGSRSSMPSRAGSSLDLVVTMSCGMTLQICLIIALSFRCIRWRFGFVNDQVSLAWSNALHTRAVHAATCLTREVMGEQVAAPWISSRRFLHALWLKVHSHWLLRACLLGSKRKLPPPACQARLRLSFVNALIMSAYIWVFCRDVQLRRTNGQGNGLLKC